MDTSTSSTLSYALEISGITSEAGVLAAKSIHSRLYALEYSNYDFKRKIFFKLWLYFFFYQDFLIYFHSSFEIIIFG